MTDGKLRHANRFSYGPSLLFPPDRRCFCVIFPFDCLTTLHSFSAASSRDVDSPPLVFDLAVRERQTRPYYLAS
ncbi:hypothetical protein FJTKL_01604 [Diaporthe vaccinii]|uniref:Uncharacterized protein n=1 Tax=Diaporthe vaccinii TaxID=105482 RepID=A0ABR4E019_9PEZI